MKYISLCLKKLIILILFASFQNLYAKAYDIDYYGIVSKDIDQNMAKMISDLYFTQLNEIQEINLNDKREQICLDDIPQKETLSDANLSFFAEITKSKDSEIWLSTIYVINKGLNEEHKKVKEYDSFYKILMESKNTLKDTITQLLENNNSDNSDALFNKQIAEPQSITSTENLSGTWSGEDFIDKIVILRGGRGFVIFNNGASMNISVTLDNTNGQNNVIITQKGKSNASFYPDLPRPIALSAALEAKPIEWQLSIIDNNTLSGIKHTIKENGESYIPYDLKVKWNRVN